MQPRRKSRLNVKVGTLLALSLVAACDSPSSEPVPDMTQPAHMPAEQLPTVLTYPGGPALEALVSGTLRRRGPCLVLDTGSRSDLILWLDDVEGVRLNENGWLIIDNSTGQRFREGDYLQGGGGSLPENLDIEAVTPEEMPFECETGSAIVFYGVRKAKRPETRAGEPPDPPPAPPPPPNVIESVKNQTQSPDFPLITLSGVADPREALFVHLIGEYRMADHFQNRTICLVDSVTALVARLDRRFPNIEPDRACGWKDGGVILKRNNESALFLHAKVDCNGKECAAEGGGTYGNLGGECSGYVMRRKGDGWTIRKTGLSVVS